MSANNTISWVLLLQPIANNKNVSLPGNTALLHWKNKARAPSMKLQIHCFVVLKYILQYTVNVTDAQYKSTNIFKTIRVLSIILNYFFPSQYKKKKKNRKELQDKTCKTFILHELLGSYKTGISDEAQERFQLKVS